MRSLILMVTLLAAPWLQAQAATIYKCVEAGRTSYGDRPCKAGGAALAVQDVAPDPETLARLERARAVAEQIDAGHARQAALERQHALHAQANVRHEQARKARCERLRLEQKWADEDAFRSSGNAREPARIAARRKAEALRTECPS